MNIVVIGAGGNSKVVLDILEMNNYNVIGLLDDDKSIHGKEVLGVNVIGSIDMLDSLSPTDTKVILSFGDPKLREKMYDIVKQKGFSFEKCIHPSAVISKHASIAEGVIINAGVTIHPDVDISNNVVIGMNSSISHDSVVESFVHISPGARLTGNTTVKKCADVGAGVTVIPGITIGQDSIIGAGAVVTKDIPANCTAVGIPAKPIKYHNG